MPATAALLLLLAVPSPAVGTAAEVHPAAETAACRRSMPPLVLPGVALPGAALPGVALPAAETATACADAAPLPAGPTDCAVPGLDDRCEQWIAAPWDGSGEVDVPGDGITGHRTLVETPDGTTLVVGGTTDRLGGTGYDYDHLVTAFDAASGAPRWSATDPGDAQFPLAHGISMAVAPDAATVYALAIAYAEGYGDAIGVISGFDARTGERRARRTIALPGGLLTVPVGIVTGSVVDANGNATERLYVSGYRYDGVVARDAFVMAFDLDDAGDIGALAWEAEYLRGAGNIALAFTITPDGETLIVGAGESTEDGLRADMTTFALHTSDGALLWEAKEPYPRTYAHNGVTGLAVSPDGSRVFAHGLGNLPDGTKSGLLTYAYDVATGERLWGASRGGLSHFSMLEGTVAVSADGGTVVVVGERRDETRVHGWTLVAYDATSGAERWVQSSLDAPRGVPFLGFYPAVTIAGSTVVVTQPRGEHHASAATTAAFDLASGQQRWMARWQRGSTYPMTVVASRDGGRAYVVGTSNERELWPLRAEGFSYDLALVAYDVS